MEMTKTGHANLGEDPILMQFIFDQSGPSLHVRVPLSPDESESFLQTFHTPDDNPSQSRRWRLFVKEIQTEFHAILKERIYKHQVETCKQIARENDAFNQKQAAP